DARAALALAASEPESEVDAQFPNRTNVSWYSELASGAATDGRRIRARIFERGVGETLSSGTGASGAAVALVEDRGGRPGGTRVTVLLDGGEHEVEGGEEVGGEQRGGGKPRVVGGVSCAVSLADY